MMIAMFLVYATGLNPVAIPPNELNVDLRLNGAPVYLDLQQGRIIRFNEQLNYRTYSEQRHSNGRSTVNIQHETGRSQGELRFSARHGQLQVELSGRWRTSQLDCTLRRVVLPVERLPFSYEDEHPNGCSYRISIDLADW